MEVEINRENFSDKVIYKEWMKKTPWLKSKKKLSEDINSGEKVELKETLGTQISSKPNCPRKTRQIPQVEREGAYAN